MVSCFAAQEREVLRERGERTGGEKERGREKRREIVTIVIVTCIKLS